MNKDDREITVLIINETIRELTGMAASGKLSKVELAGVRHQIDRLRRKRTKLLRAPWPARWILRLRALTSGGR